MKANRPLWKAFEQ